MLIIIYVSVEILTKVRYLILSVQVLLKEHLFWYIKTEKGWVVEAELIFVASGTVLDIDVWMLFCYKMVVLV